ncbi:hypothetical protein H181DRAFT_05571 [Streptomyces sp. WMMB 714]|nr:hypothetical protein H181DRAFT_05571 [Streptomyces sp. WMMB 714]
MESGGPKPDQSVSALVQIDGGSEQRERAARTFDALEWPHREPAPADTPPVAEDGSCFRWVAIPVAGARRRAGHEANWLLQEVVKREQLPLTGRVFRDPPRRARRRERMWQAFLSPHTHGPRASLHRLGVLTGRFDVGESIYGDRDTALALARHAVPADQQVRIGVRRSDRVGLPLLFMLGTAACIALAFTIADRQVLWQWQDVLVAVAFVVYYSTGLTLFARRQRWGTLSVTVLPLLIAVLTLTLPGLGHLTVDEFAQGLGVAPDDFPIPAPGQLDAYLQVGLPPLFSALFFIAAWGLLRHFHLVRRGSVPALTAVLVLATLTMAWSVRSSISHAAESASLVRSANPDVLPERTRFFGLHARWYCVEPTVPADELSTHGDRLNPRQAYMSYNPDADRLTLLSSRGDGSVSVKSDQVRLVKFHLRTEGDFRCPGPAGH